MKRWRACRMPRRGQVAPHAGARVETIQLNRHAPEAVSPPTRGRELKHIRGLLSSFRRSSPPTRGRELKPR